MRQRLAAAICALVRVKGDGMAPAIPDGAFIRLNAAKRFTFAPGIYAFTRDGEAFAKRHAVTSTALDGTPAPVLLISDNPAYPPVSLAGNDLESLKIVGRVRGVLAFGRCCRPRRGNGDVGGDEHHLAEVPDLGAGHDLATGERQIVRHRIAEHRGERRRSPAHRPGVVIDHPPVRTEGTQLHDLVCRRQPTGKAAITDVRRVDAGML